MKRKLRTIIVVAVSVWLLLIALFGVFIFFNDILLSDITRSFQCGIRKSEAAVELLEVESICGKLYGNGNGMNYFGAALVTADSAEELDTLVAELGEDFGTVGYTVQDGTEVNTPYLAPGKLSFKYADFKDDETYYCIYFYIYEHPASNIFDIRGY